MLFIDHNYIFLSPSATILRVYNIKYYNKNLCVANLWNTWVYVYVHITTNFFFTESTIEIEYKTTLY
jgi:hypothetical protein